jgi:putative pyruvate formate lyase activating enzyme
MNKATDKTVSGYQRLDCNAPELGKRMVRASAALTSCQICPRRCLANRAEGETGECQAANEILVSSWNLHHGEEPPLSGSRGSGTIFFAGCSMSCAYCQNYTISQEVEGTPIAPDKLVEIMFHIERAGAHNINFVTPTHYAVHILKACITARRNGLRVPFVYNTSGYDLVETLRWFDGIMDIYLADMRYDDPAVAALYSRADDYPAINRLAIAEMHRQVGVLKTDADGIAVSGLIIRHLILPEGLSGSEGIFTFLAREVSPETYISLMSQYYPTHRAHEMAKIGRRITEKEYERARAAMEAAGLENGWVQDL